MFKTDKILFQFWWVAWFDCSLTGILILNILLLCSFILFTFLYVLHLTCFTFFIFIVSFIFYHEFVLYSLFSTLYKIYLSDCIVLHYFDIFHLFSKYLHFFCIPSFSYFHSLIHITIWCFLSYTWCFDNIHMRVLKNTLCTWTSSRVTVFIYITCTIRVFTVHNIILSCTALSCTVHVCFCPLTRFSYHITSVSQNLYWALLL